MSLVTASLKGKALQTDEEEKTPIFGQDPVEKVAEMLWSSDCEDHEEEKLAESKFDAAKEKLIKKAELSKLASLAGQIFEDPFLGRIALYGPRDTFVSLAEGRYGSSEELNKLASMSTEDLVELYKLVM